MLSIPSDGDNRVMADSSWRCILWRDKLCLLWDGRSHLLRDGILRLLQGYATGAKCLLTGIVRATMCVGVCMVLIGCAEVQSVEQQRITFYTLQPPSVHFDVTRTIARLVSVHTQYDIQIAPIGDTLQAQLPRGAISTALAVGEIDGSVSNGVGADNGNDSNNRNEAGNGNDIGRDTVENALNDSVNYEEHPHYSVADNAQLLRLLGLTPNSFTIIPSQAMYDSARLAEWAHGDTNNGVGTLPQPQHSDLHYLLNVYPRIFYFISSPSTQIPTTGYYVPTNTVVSDTTHPTDLQMIARMFGYGDVSRIPVLSTLNDQFAFQFGLDAETVFVQSAYFPYRQLEVASASSVFHLVSLPLEMLQNITVEYPVYAKTTLPLSIDSTIINTTDIETLYSGNVLVASLGTNIDIIDNVCQAILQNFNEYRASFPFLEIMQRHDLYTTIPPTIRHPSC